MRLKFISACLCLCMQSVFAANIQGIYKEESNEEADKDSKQTHIFKEECV